MKELCEPSANRWVFKAIAYKSARSRGFVGYGDADPSNVSSLVHGAAMRVAETRAANHALRKAYGIGLCSLEELEWSPRPLGPDRPNQTTPPTNGNNGHHNGQPRLRDQLCLLIRKHKLDAGLVRAYAADYCGTPALRDASRTQIESFGKLNWFLRDFGYDTDLLGRDEIDERALVGLRGIVQISHTRLSGRSFLNLERFAPAADWEEVSTAVVNAPDGQEQGHDL